MSLVVGTQQTALIPQTTLQTLWANTPHKFIGRLSAADAEIVARTQGPGRGIDESIGTIRARFQTTTSNLEDRVFFKLGAGTRQRFRSVDVDLGGWHAAEHERAETIAEVKSRHALAASTGPRVTLADLAKSPASVRKNNAVEKATPTPSAPRSRWG